MATPGFSRSFNNEDLVMNDMAPQKGIMANRMRNLVKSYEQTKMDKCNENQMKLEEYLMEL